jgi:MFS family permease
VLALASACGGVAAIALIGGNKGNPSSTPRGPGMKWSEFSKLAREPVFLLLLGGMFLCNFPQILVASQMNLMLMESGASMGYATALVSLYSVCVVIGRLASGYALDRMAPHLVAIIALGLPALGYIALASSFDARWILAGSIGLVGLAQGAETDVGAFLTSRRFDLGHFSFVFSMLMTSMGLASALGALLLSYTLYLTDSYNIFLYVAAGMTLSGALFFYLTGRHDKVVLQAEPDPAMPPTIA